MAEGDTTRLVGDNPGVARRSNSYTQPFEFSAELSSKHYTAGIHRVRCDMISKAFGWIP